MSYVDNAESTEDSLGQGFEMVKHNTCKNVLLMPGVNQVVARIMVKNGYQLGRGLGRHLQGKRAPISLLEKQDKFGLGYEASLEGEMQSLSFIERYPKPIPHLRETFPAPAEVMQPEGRERPQI
ncbi:G-patch domain [Sesbania bispinosa]|nr:G-patch domain [Sesbania bispinosa]